MIKERNFPKNYCKMIYEIKNVNTWGKELLKILKQIYLKIKFNFHIYKSNDIYN